MSIVILLAVLIVIVLMIRAALGPPHLSPAQAAALGRGVADDVGEVAVRRFVAGHDHHSYAPDMYTTDADVDEPVADPPHEPHEPSERHDTTSFHVEADDPSTCHGYDADSSTSSDDVSCDSDSGGWSDD